MLKSLEALEKSSDELNALKTVVNEPVDNANINTTKKNVPKTEKERNWIQRQRDGATSKEEWKTNTLTNVARVA